MAHFERSLIMEPGQGKVALILSQPWLVAFQTPAYQPNHVWQKMNGKIHHVYVDVKLMLMVDVVNWSNALHSALKAQFC